jgi:hypothetical protein
MGISDRTEEPTANTDPLDPDGSSPSHTARTHAPAAQRQVKRPRRGRRLRRRASKREHDCLRAALRATARIEHPEFTETQIHRYAESELARLKKREPGVVALFEAMEMSSTAPDRKHLNPHVEMAATLAQPSISEMLRILASTPLARGPIPDLSTAVAVVVDQALRPSRCDIRSAYWDMENGQVSRRWSLNLPTAEPCESQLYRQIETITGSVAQDKPGHDPTIYIHVNLDVLRELSRLTDEHGELRHPEMFKIMILDGSRIEGPVSQVTPLNAEHLRLLTGPELAGVDYSVYDHGGQYDSVLGWRLVLLVDRDSGLPVIWAIVPATAYEPRVLLDLLLPQLFELWPDCPLHTIISDNELDSAPACGALEARWSIHPVFTRHNAKHVKATAKRGVTFTTVDGQPQCGCGTDRPMTFRGREGFLSVEQRAAKGLARGVLAPNTKEARLRWICPSCKTERSTYALKQIGSEQWPLANDHLWYPIRGAGEHTDMHKVLCLYRNLVEQAFAIMKGIGVGSDEPALWAQDLGIVHLLGMHLTLRSARRLAHENGTYELLATEHDKLGLGTKDAKPPSNRKIRRRLRKRPQHLRWSWPTPQRLKHSDA